MSPAENMYRRIALSQMPRLLSRMDRELPSQTYGSFDRTFWAWKFTDFPGARFQEGLYALSWFYLDPSEENSFYENPRLLDWIVAGFSNWRSLQHADGSFDEAYPFERSLAATSFTVFYLAEAQLMLAERLPESVRNANLVAFRHAGEWLCRNDEHHGVLSNHLAVAAAALAVIARLTGEELFEKRSRYFIDRILSCQSVEGWYEEYGGADFGYQTHGMFYLARIWSLTKDTILLDSLMRSVAFLKHFVHPNGTLGGEYGSRNTSFFFPAGFEILSTVCPDAANIINFLRGSVQNQKAAGLAMMDAYNFCPLLNNYLFAANFATHIEQVPELPFMGEGQKWFPQAGLLVHTTSSYQAVFAPSKGGVLKIYDKKTGKLAVSDCGYWYDLPEGGRASSQSFSRENDAEISTKSAVVTAPFAKIKQRVMTPWLFLAFRMFTLTLGRHNSLGLKVKALLVKVLVSGRKTIGLTLVRRIDFSEAKVMIQDEIRGPVADKGKLHLQIGTKFSTIHMGSSRYFQGDDLDPVLLDGSASVQRKFIWRA